MKKNVPRFLNRLLGLTLPEQRMAFGFFQVRRRGGYSAAAWLLNSPADDNSAVTGSWMYST